MRQQTIDAALEVTHSTFSLERTYPHSLARVFLALSDKGGEAALAG